MLCYKPVFHAFLREKYPDEWHESMADRALDGSVFRDRGALRRRAFVFGLLNSTPNNFQIARLGDSQGQEKLNGEPPKPK
jgi:hypothetical protein